MSVPISSVQISTLIFIFVTLQLGKGVKINKLQVPEVIQHGTPVVLDCDFTLEATDEDLVVKWFFNKNKTLVYQWIPGSRKRPQGLGILKDRLNLEYAASVDANSVHRALHILKAGPDLSGDYTCSVSTLQSEDIRTKSMLVFGVFLIPSVSHQVVYQPIWKELSLRGHEVTVITPNPLKDPSLTNLTEIDGSSAYKIAAESNLNKKITHWDMVEILSEFLERVADHQLGLPETKKLIRDQNRKFDLVLVEFLNPVGSAFSVKYKCPLVGVASLSVTYVGHEAVGNPVHPILYPDLMTTFGNTLNFYERVESFLYYLWYRFHYYFVSLPKLDGVVKKHFGKDMPYLGDIERNVSMLFLNTNPLIHKARSLPPNVIELGRMHLKPKKPLPKDLQDFLDSAKEGVVYFSLGSNVKSALVAPDKLKVLMETFAELPFKVLWKFENDTLQGKPPNVKIDKWLPQQDLLGHPNIKLFITQGGLQSLEEAIFNNVPLVGMPFFADQFFNVDRMQFLGIGHHVDFPTLTKKALKDTILEVASNPKYKSNIKRVSKILQDEPMSGLEKAIWWIEYVLRHKNVAHLKNPAQNMSWCQFLLLDVIGFLATIVILILYVLYKTFKIAKVIFAGNSNVSKRKKKL